MLSLLSAALTFSGGTPPLATRLHRSRAGPIAASLVNRRAMLGAAAAALAVPAAAFADKPAVSDGKWAQHDQDEAFTDEFFAGFTKSPTGLEYSIVQEGYGVKPKPGQGIKAHYSGYLLKGAKFDSSYERRKTLGFDVGTGRVIKGWDEALLDMKVGEQRILKIPSNLAYGSKGAGGIIPPDATLVFYVELVALTS